ncbi:hypothetical protein BN1263170259 [Stenotrophomonas maltophilia]|nr:hypothetical protein BN1263170259 [Stenotrophomonas maltophilia]
MPFPKHRTRLAIWNHGKRTRPGRLPLGGQRSAERPYPVLGISRLGCERSAPAVISAFQNRVSAGRSGSLGPSLDAKGLTLEPDVEFTNSVRHRTGQLFLNGRDEQLSVLDASHYPNQIAKHPQVLAPPEAVTELVKHFGLPNRLLR